ncbi:hypothetical protein SOVF_030180 [Spinacia oleracea]|nr:hypothetical protein SOVF_030180 [Spinacia oleracea]
MVAESSTIAVPPAKQTVQHSPTFLQDKELTPKLNRQNTFPSLSELSSSLNEPQIRRKRRRTCEQPSFQQLVAATNQINLGLSEITPSLKRDNHFVSWPQNFTFQSTGVNNKSVQGSESKQPSVLAKNHCQVPRKSPSGIRRNTSNAGLLALDGNNIGNEREEEVVDFSKAIEDAISRIESLIPSLQKMVKSDHDVSSSVNPTGNEKDRVNNTNELRLIDKSAAFGETIMCNPSVPSQVKRSRNVGYVGNGDGMQQQMVYSQGNVDSRRNETKCSKVNTTQRIVDKPSEWVSAQSDDRMKNLPFEKNSNVQSISQVSEPKFKAVFGRPELRKGMSRNGSFASHASERTQGLRVMPRQPFRGEAIEREATLRPYVGSTNSMRPSRASNTRSSRQKWSQSHTSGRIAEEMGQSSKVTRFRDSSNRNTLIRKNMKGTLHSKSGPHDHISEETSWSSCTSSSATTQQSGSPSSSSGSYESSVYDSYENDESEPLHETVGQSSRMKRSEVTESAASGYDSYYDSQNEYSDAGSSSQMSSARLHKWDPQKERGKRKGRLRRLGRKLGMIFHHHHHHHHHHYKDEPDPRHARSFLKRFGEMLHLTKSANNRQKIKFDEPRKSEIKTLVKRKQQGGHFHALVGGLMKHMKHTKKPKQVKNGIKGLESGRHGGKKEGTKLPWWPKIHGGKGGVKVSNNRKVRLGNYRSKSFAAAKMILKK